MARTGEPSRGPDRSQVGTRRSHELEAFVVPAFEGGLTPATIVGAVGDVVARLGPQHVVVVPAHPVFGERRWRSGPARRYENDTERADGRKYGKSESYLDHRRLVPEGAVTGAGVRALMVGRELRLDQVGRSDNARVMDGPEIVEHHGIVLQSARGPVVNLPELVVGGPISGSWWAHPRHDEIFRVLNEASGSDDVVRLRLVEGHLALVHRRLWPALARLRDRIGSDAMASVQEEHTSSGAHRSRTVPFPDWVPPEVLLEAAQLSELEAIEQIPAGVLPSRPGP